MDDLLRDIDAVLLMGPGPSCVPPQVYAALARPTIGHMDPAFIGIMDRIKVMLQELMRTTNPVTLPMSGTGSAGMETCFANLVEPGDRVLILVNGVFGQRMADVAARLGGQVETLEFDWGTPVDPGAVEQRLASGDRRALVAVVHAETSTGVRNPVEHLAPLVRAHGALYLVDAVTSLGGAPVDVDAWAVDALYSGTQKCLSVPPGLAPVTLSARAVDKLRGRSSKVSSWYLDLNMITQYWEGASRVYHHTAPVNMLYGLYAGLQLILDEGLDKVHARHTAAHARLVAGLEQLGLEMLVEPDFRLPMLNAVRVPANVDEAAVRRRLLQHHRIEIGAGLGPLAGQIWRIGLMGHTARAENVDRFLTALQDSLP